MEHEEHFMQMNEAPQSASGWVQPALRKVLLP